MLCRLLSVVLLCFIVAVNSQRNSNSEAVCAPFLTGPTTTPLIPSNTRNLTVDENAEFECELVLQDVALPTQIRLTIHEGLSYLALRHVEIGLRRHNDVMRHLDMMTKILPGKHSFQYRAGAYSMDHMVNNPNEAILYLENAVYGQASTDEEALEQDKYLASRFLISAYCAVERYEDALALIVNSLEQYPVDFGIYGVFKNMKTHVAGTNLYKLAIAQDVFEDVESAYQLVQKYFYVNYTNSHAQSAMTLYDTAPPTADEFYDHIRDRKMLKIDANAIYNPDTQASEFWKSLPVLINEYTDCEKLQKFDGLAEIFVEMMPKSMITNGVKRMGYGLYSTKVMLHYRDYLKFVYCKRSDDNSEMTSVRGNANGIIGQQPISRNNTYYANVQYKEVSTDMYYNTYKNHLYRGAYADQQPLFIQNNKNRRQRVKSTIYNTPLHLYNSKNDSDLKLEMPPIFSASSNRYDFNVIKDLVDVNLWMGREEVINNQVTTTVSKLHVDSYDNLYILLKGTKTFITISPEYGSKLATLYPTYNVGANGVSFRTSGNIYLPWKFTNHSSNGEEKGAEATTTTDGDSVADVRQSVKGVVPPALYPLDTINAHFSTIDHTELIEYCTLNQIPFEVVELKKPGDIFFLPAGVFHQVTTTSSAEANYQHMALNYWWKPANYQNISKLYEANALGKLRESVLKELL